MGRKYVKTTRWFTSRADRIKQDNLRLAYLEIGKLVEKELPKVMASGDKRKAKRLQNRINNILKRVKRGKPIKQEMPKKKVKSRKRKERKTKKPKVVRKKRKVLLSQEIEKNNELFKVNTREELIKERAEEKERKRFKQKIEKMPELTEYLKKETISSVTRHYGQLAENEKGAYGELLDKAMLNPAKFKDLLIDKMDSLKSNLEIGVNIIVSKNGLKKHTDLTVTGHTLNEVKQALSASGLNIGSEITGYGEVEYFKELLGNVKIKNYMKKKGKIKDMIITIRLIRGKM